MWEELKNELLKQTIVRIAGAFEAVCDTEDAAGNAGAVVGLTVVCAEEWTLDVARFGRSFSRDYKWVILCKQ